MILIALCISTAGARPGWAAGQAFGQLRDWAAALNLPEITSPVPAVTPRLADNLPGPSGLPEYHAVLKKSKVICTAHKGPLKVSATFRHYEATANIDAQNIANSQLQVTVDAASVEADTLVPLPDKWFRKALQVDTYPTATMRSLAIRPTQKQDNYEADVEIVFMGQLYQKTVTVILSREGNDLRLKGSLALKLKSGRRVSETYDILMSAAADQK